MFSLRAAGSLNIFHFEYSIVVPSLLFPLQLSNCSADQDSDGGGVSEWHCGVHLVNALVALSASLYMCMYKLAECVPCSVLVCRSTEAPQ